MTTAPPTISDLVALNVAGQRQAAEFQKDLGKRFLDSDALFIELRGAFDAGESERARGFCRVMQKYIERLGGA